MSTKQQTNQASQKKPKEAPQHVKAMHELTQPKAKIIQITKEDQKKIANVKRILQELNFEGAMWPDEDIYTVLKERVNHYSEAEIYQAAALYIMEAREQPEQWQEVGGKAKKVKKAEDNKNRPRNPSDANKSPNTASGEHKPRGRPQRDGQQRDGQHRDGQQRPPRKTESGDHAVTKGQEHATGAQNEQTQQSQQHQRQQSQQRGGPRGGPRGQQQHQQQQPTNGVATVASTPANGTISWANKVKGEPKPQPPQQQPQQTQEQKPTYKQKEHATHGNPPSHPAQQHRTAPAVTKAQQQQQQASQTTQANTAAVREVSEIESNVAKLTINPATVNLPPLTSTPASSTVPSFGRVQDNGPRINLPGTGLEQPPGLKVHFGQPFETEKPAKTETKPVEQSPLPVVTQTPTLPQATPVVAATQTPQTAAKPQTPAEGAVPTMMPSQFPALFPFQYPMSLMNPQMFYDPSQLASAPTQTNTGRDQQDASATQQSTAGQPGVAPYQGYGTDAAAWANSLNTAGAYPYHMQQLVNQQGYVAYQTQPNSQFYPPYGRPGPYQKGPYWNMNYGGAYPQPYSGTGTEDQDYMKHSLSGQGYPQQHTAHTNPSQTRFFNNASGTTGTTGQGMMDNKQQGVQQGQQSQAVGQQGQPGYGAEHEFPYPGYHQFQNYSSFVQPGMQVPQQLPYQQQRTNPNYQQ
eukprot:TRINITY_DN86_c1_g1_i1.p1 TRINITY_DN86_c1_g1~~TRINITY_DN86_c1_g1_i1.p1  ORF type:complete len:690 (-),score=222.32 TRINITY_DN86_c1_g1_i1:132-2201(-)